MRCSSALGLILILPLFGSSLIQAQSESPGLKVGATVDRTLAKGQRHSYNITLDPDQVLQLVVDQHGIDVVVRAFSPAGKLLGEFDSPNGTEGPENVSILSDTAGAYRIEVSPLGQFDDVATGRYEIKIVELRAATDQELQAGKNGVVLKARGLALLAEVEEILPQIHLPDARVRNQLQAAQILWGNDDKLAGQLVNDAMEGVKEYLSKVELGDQDYFQAYQNGMQLRAELVRIVGLHDPEAALSFLRTTRVLASPDAGANDNQQAQEAQMELWLASSISAHDSKRTFQIAEETLKNGYSSSLVETLNRLRSADQDLAGKLARDIVTKLEGGKLLDNPEAANLAVQLLWAAHATPRRQSGDTSSAKTDAPLLSDQDYRDLFAKTLADGLAFTAPANNNYSPERNAAQNILNSLKQMTKEMQAIAPQSIAAVEKRATELNTPSDPQAQVWQKYQETMNNGTVEAATEAAGKAPRGMRDQLFQNLATNVATRGDLARAKQILNDNLANPVQKRQALNNLEQIAIRNLMNRGKTEEAIRNIANLRTRKERAQLLSELANQIGPGLKRAAALAILEQARAMVTTSGQADDADQMSALLEIARAFARYDPQRGFEIVEPLLDQFNEMSSAALVLNGFGQTFYQEGEFIMHDGNLLANIAERLLQSLGSLTPTNFDRAKAAADRLQRQEVRVSAYLVIAQQAVTPEGRQMRRVSY